MAVESTLDILQQEFKLKEKLVVIKQMHLKVSIITQLQLRLQVIKRMTRRLLKIRLLNLKICMKNGLENRMETIRRFEFGRFIIRFFLY